MKEHRPQMSKVIFINSHPIQYFVPLYQHLNRNGIIAECWYCSDENVRGHFDRQFATKVAWDIPLLEGYPYRFFPNRSWKASLYNGFFGLINPGAWRALSREPRSVVVVHGWNYVTHMMIIVIGWLRGHRVCIRGESPLNQEMKKSSLNRFLKKIFLQGILFRFVHHFLFIGRQNKAFYHYYGVPEEKLVFTPYAVDNERFRQAATSLSKTSVRTELGIPQDAFVVLYTGKFIDKKRPMDLLQAFDKLSLPNKFLVMVGDGELRASMEQFILQRQLSNKVKLTGFVNQTEIVKYYACADVFVLCSGEGETWGLSVNEAMNFDLPVVVSRTVGCAEDLATDTSGFTFETGNVDDLASKLRQVSNLLQVPSAYPPHPRESSAQPFRPSEVVDRYSFEQIATQLKRNVIFTD